MGFEYVRSAGHILILAEFEGKVNMEDMQHRIRLRGVRAALAQSDRICTRRISAEAVALLHCGKTLCLVGASTITGSTLR